MPNYPIPEIQKLAPEECTSILASHAAVVVGVDNSPKLVKESKR